MPGLLRKTKLFADYSCRRYRQMLSAYIDAKLSSEAADLITDHLDDCPDCRECHQRILHAARLVSTLHLPTNNPAGIPPWIQPSRIESTTGRSFVGWKSLAAAGAVVILIFGSLLYFRRSHLDPGLLQAIRLSGTPLINSMQMDRTGSVVPGDMIETDEKSRAMLNLGSVGQVELDPETRLRLIRTRSNEQKFSLERGKVFATITAPPRVFVIETPSAVAIDLGCSYSLEVDSSGQSSLYVLSGMVALASHDRETLIPVNSVCRARPGVGPGTPYSSSASQELQAALADFDFGNGGSRALQAVLKNATPGDALTLLELLKRAEAADRNQVYEKLALYVSPPGGVTRAGMLQLDPQMFQMWHIKIDEQRHRQLTSTPQASGTVRLTGTMQTERSLHCATALPDGRILVTGGWDSYGNALASAEVYDPAKGRFVDAGRMTSPRAGHTATLLANGMVLIAGGTSSPESSGILATAELFDSRTGRFVPAGHLETARMRQEATRLNDGRVLITGGVGANEESPWLSSAEIYDPDSGSFISAGSMHEARSAHSATLLNDGQVLIAGGFSTINAPAIVEKSAELYNPATNAFSVINRMNFPRFHHSAVLLRDGRVLIAGGNVPDRSDPRNPRQYTTAELFDPATGKFIKSGDMILDRFKVRSSAVLLPDGKVLIAGGSWGFEVYDPASGSFSVQTGAMSLARYYSTASLLSSGEVIIIGGYSGIEPADFYHSSAGAWLYQPE